MSLRLSRIRLVWSALPGSTSPRFDRIVGEVVQRVLRRRGFRFRARADDVALRRRHGFVPKEFHERVDAGYDGIAESWYEEAQE